MAVDARRMSRSDEKKVSFHIGEEGEEEEEAFEIRERSYDLFHPPPEEERDLGTIIRDTFGFYKKKPTPEEDPQKHFKCAEGVVHRYTLSNAAGLEVRVMTLGATILSIRMPDNKMVKGDVLLGFDTLEEYLNEEKNKLSFGSVFGRYSSYISNAQIKIDREEYCLSTNIKGIHHACGGFRGFDKALWSSHVAYNRVIMSHVSPDGDEGYPGTLMVQVSFQLTKNNRLVVVTTATTSKPTVLSLGHNLFFNMAGQERGPEGLQEHTLLVNADRYIKNNEYTKAPDGDLTEVGSSYFDLRVPRPIWKAMKKIPGGGYNTTFCLTKGYPMHSITFATRLMHPNSGRYLEILTDMPSLHINTGTTLPDPDAKPPLEAQTGFNEEAGYPQFCRDARNLEDLAAEMETSESQVWPRNDPAITKTEIKENIPEAKTIQEMTAKKSNLEEEGDEEASEIDNTDYLKDDAQSEEEERKVPDWKPPEPIIGKKGAQYKKNGAITFMTQEFPDFMTREKIPKPIIKPGDTYSRTTVYKFGIVPLRPDREKYFAL